jgi:dTMP kinase
MNKRQGVFIVFEGGDGVGKTTQLDWLEASLLEAGHDVLRTFEPGATPVGAQLRELLLHDPLNSDPTDRTEALLYAADKADHVAKVIEPALRARTVVICDRYVDSMIAYQSAGRGLSGIADLADWATGGLHPDLTILLDADVADAVAEIEDKDRLESAGRDFHERVRAGFLELAAADPSRYLVLNARDSREQIAAQIRARLADFGLELSEPSEMLVP